MSEAITIDRARLDFDEILRGLREGKTYLVTKDGEAVARIEPAATRHKPLPGAKERLIAHGLAQPVLNAGPWTRDELYDDE